MLHTQPAVLERHGAAGETGDVALVRRDDHGGARGGEAAEQLDHRPRGVGVEIARGFVGGDDRRIVGERARNRDALLLAAGERRRQLVRAVGQTDVREQLERALAALAHRPGSQEIHRQRHVLGDGQRRQQLEELEHDPHRRAAEAGERALGRTAERHAGHRDVTRGRAVDPADQVEQRRLAAAGFARDGDELAGSDVEIDLGESRERSGRGGVGLGDTA